MDNNKYILIKNMNNILDKIFDNDNLIKLIKYDDNQPLSQPILKEPRILIYDRIYPFRYIPDVQTETKTFVNVIFKNLSSIKTNNAFSSTNIIVNILCHKALIQTIYGSRLFCLWEEVNNALEGQRLNDKFKIKFEYSNEIMGIKDYSGYFINYKVLDFK